MCSSQHIYKYSLINNKDTYISSKINKTNYKTSNAYKTKHVLGTFVEESCGTFSQGESNAPVGVWHQCHYLCHQQPQLVCCHGNPLLRSHDTQLLILTWRLCHYKMTGNCDIYLATVSLQNDRNLWHLPGDCVTTKWQETVTFTWRLCHYKMTGNCDIYLETNKKSFATETYKLTVEGNETRRATCLELYLDELCTGQWSGHLGPEWPVAPMSPLHTETSQVSHYWWHHVTGVTMSLVTPCHWCHHVTGVAMSLGSPCHWCHWCHHVTGVTMSLVTPCHWCHHVTGVAMSLVTPCHWCHWCHHVTGVIGVTSPVSHLRCHCWY